MWIMWLEGAEVYTLDDNLLTILLRDCGDTAKHKAQSDKEDFESLVNDYYKKDLKIKFIFSLDEIEGISNGKNQEQSLEDQLREMFGNNLEIID